MNSMKSIKILAKCLCNEMSKKSKKGQTFSMEV